MAGEVERSEAYRLARRRLGGVAAAVEDDPLLMSEFAIALLGHANRRAAAGACSQEEWVDRLLAVAGLMVGRVADWEEMPWSVALQLVADKIEAAEEAMLEAEEFEQDVLRDIGELPE